MPVRSSTKRRRSEVRQESPGLGAERPSMLSQNPLATARGMLVAIVLSIIAWVALTIALVRWVL